MMRDRQALIDRLDGYKLSPDVTVYVEHYGAVYIPIGNTIDIFATPDWDGHNELQIEVRSIEDQPIEGDVFVVDWTGNVETDMTIWEALVIPYVRKYKR